MAPPHHSFWIEASADMLLCSKYGVSRLLKRSMSVVFCMGIVELRHCSFGGVGKSPH